MPAPPDSTSSPPTPLAIDWTGPWGSVAMHLLPDRAAYRPDLDTLYLADVHLGKPEHFRRAGAPVPECVTDHDLTRISALLDSTGAGRLVILGDLFHAGLPDTGATMRSLIDWRGRHHETRVVLVRGNHDRHMGDPPAGARIACLLGPCPDPDYPDDPVWLVHEPEHVDGDRPHLAGHVHPGVRLPKITRRGHFGERARCFWFGRRVAVFPAFGRFTGMVIVEPEPGDAVVLTDDRTLIDVSAVFSRPPAGRRLSKNSHAPRA